MMNLRNIGVWARTKIDEKLFLNIVVKWQIRLIFTFKRISRVFSLKKLPKWDWMWIVGPRKSLSKFYMDTKADITCLAPLSSVSVICFVGKKCCHCFTEKIKVKLSALLFLGSIYCKQCSLGSRLIRVHIDCSH